MVALNKTYLKPLTPDRLAKDSGLYYDRGYDGTGYKDYAKGIAYPTVKVALKMALPPSSKQRSATISKATGEGTEIVKQGIVIPAGQKEYSVILEIPPLTGTSVTVE